MKKLFLIITSFILCLSCVSCNLINNASEKLTSTADGITIVPGKTTLKEILDQGYTYEFSKAFQPITEIEGKKYISVAVDIFKDGKHFASVGLVNKSSSAKPLEDCAISDYWYYCDKDPKSSSNYKFSEILVNGENLVGLSKDEIKSKFDKEASEYSDEIIFNYSGYEYEFKFDDNNIVNFIGFDIDEYK